MPFAELVLLFVVAEAIKNADNIRDSMRTHIADIRWSPSLRLLWDSSHRQPVEVAFVAVPSFGLRRLDFPATVGLVAVAVDHIAEMFVAAVAGIVVVVVVELADLAADVVQAVAVVDN